MIGDREDNRTAEVGKIACSAAVTREEVAAHKMAGAVGEVETGATAVDAGIEGIVVVVEAAKMGTRAPEERCPPLATTIKISSQRRRC